VIKHNQGNLSPKVSQSPADIMKPNILVLMRSFRIRSKQCEVSESEANNAKFPNQKQTRCRMAESKRQKGPSAFYKVHARVGAHVCSAYLLCMQINEKIPTLEQNSKVQMRGIASRGWHPKQRPHRHNKAKICLSAATGLRVILMHFHRNSRLDMQCQVSG
jgi:hypothetical protein